MIYSGTFLNFCAVQISSRFPFCFVNWGSFPTFWVYRGLYLLNFDIVQAKPAIFYFRYTIVHIFNARLYLYSKARIANTDLKLFDLTIAKN